MKKKGFLKFLAVLGASACVLTTPVLLAGCNDAELNKLKNEVTELEQSNSALTMQITDLQSQNALLSAEISSKEEEIESKESEIADLEEEIRFKQLIIDDNYSVITLMEEENSELRDSIEDKDETIEENEAEIERLNGVVSNNNTTIAGLNSNIETLTSDKEELEKQVSDLQSDISEKSGQITTLTNQNTTLNQTIARLESEASEDAAEITRLNGVVSENETTIAGLNSNIETLTSDKEELESQVSDLQGQISQKEEQVATLTSQNETLNQTIAGLVSDVETKDAEITRLNGVVAQNEATIEQLNTTIETLTSDKETLESQVAGLEGQISTKTKQIENLTNLNTNLIAELESLESEAVADEAEITSLKAEIEENKTTIAGLNASVETLTSDKAGLEKQVSDLQSDISEKSGQITTLTNQNTTLNQTITRLENEAEVDEAEISRLNSEVAQNETTIAGLNASVETLTSDKTRLESQVLDLQGQISQKEEQVATLTSQNETLNQTIAGLESDVETKDAEITRLNGVVAQNETTIAGLNASVETLTSDKTRLESQVADLQSEISQKEEQVATLTSQNEELNETILDLNEDNEKLTTEKKALQDQVDSLEAQISASLKTIETLTSEKEALSEEKATLISEKNELIEEKESLELEVSDLETYIEEIKKHLGHEHASAYYTIQDDKVYRVEDCVCGETMMLEVKNAVIATPSTVQEILDTDVNEKIIVLAPGEYKEEILIRPNRATVSKLYNSYTGKYDPSNPSLLLSTKVTGNEISLENFLANDDLTSTAHTYKNMVYECSIRNLSIVGTEGAIVKNQIRFVQIEDPSETRPVYDAVREEFLPYGDDTRDYKYMSIFNIDGLTISNINFQSKLGTISFYNYFVESESGVAPGYIRNFKLENCSFINEDADNNQPYGALRFFTASNNFENFKIANNTVVNHYQGFLVQNVKNILVANNKISNTEHNAIAVQNNGDYYSSGEIEIINNEVSNVTDRAIRFGVIKNAIITVSGNIFKNAIDGDNELLKTQTLTNVRYYFINNTYGGDVIPDVSSFANDTVWIVNISSVNHNHSGEFYYTIEDGVAYKVQDCYCGEDVKVVVENAVIATPSTVQEILDTDVNGKTVVLSAGEYEDEILIRPSRATVSKLYNNYSRNVDPSNPALLLSTKVTGNEISLENFLANDDLTSTAHTYKNMVYECSIRNLSIVGTEGAIVKNQIRFVQIEDPSETRPVYDAVREEFLPYGDDTRDYKYISIFNIDGLTISNINFQGKLGTISFYNYFVESESGVAPGYIRNFKLENCSFINEDADNNQPYGALRFFTASNNFENFEITNNVVNNHYQGFLVQNVKNILVANNKISNTEHNAIAVQNNGDYYSSGDIQILNNQISNTTERAIRFGVIKNAIITVSGNIFENALDGDNELLKTQTMTDVLYVFENNTYAGIAMDKVVGIANASNWIVIPENPEED